MKRLMKGEDIEEEIMKEGSKKVREKMQEQKEETEIICPNCRQSKMWLTKTKRTFAWKCPSCGFDTNKPSDLSRHKRRELEVLDILKKMFPYLTFIENKPIDTNFLTGEEGKSKVKYDFKVFFFNKKLARCKVSVIQNTSQERYLTTPEQYVQGRSKVFEYLSRIDSIIVFYFPDEPDQTKKIAMASCKEIMKFATKVTDKFRLEQYHIPVEVRKAIIKTTQTEFKTLLFRNLYDLLTRNVYVV